MPFLLELFENKDALVEVFSDEKWTKMTTTTREGVAKEAPKNIPPKRLLMVSRFLFMMMVLRIMMKMLQGKLQTTSNLANFTSICRA